MMMPRWEDCIPMLKTQIKGAAGNYNNGLIIRTNMMRYFVALYFIIIKGMFFD